jgi:beta-glucosidase
MGFEKTQTSSIDQRVKELLGKMSLEEKVGQMTQVNLNVVLQGDNFNIDGTLDLVLLHEAVARFKVGSILNAINRPYPLEKWHEIIRQIQEVAVKETPNKIPVLYGIDSIHGATFTQGSTLFPHNIGLAATRNPELACKIAEITAAETRASGIRWNFDPVLDIGRNPLWSRFPETFGEDVYITRQMGLAMVEGYEQGGALDKPSAVASCIKHYVGYSVPHSGKDRTPAYIPEIQLREHHLPQFRDAIRKGSSSLMINSGEVNGIPVHSSKYLLTDVLRGELGFEGPAVSDWEDVIRLHTRHHVAASPMEAVKIAVNAGVDMSMVPHDFSFFTYLVELVKEGEVSQERIDEAAGRILKLKFRLGLFENPYPEPEAAELFGKPEYREVALQAARESVTLLKNEHSNEDGTGGVLPLKKEKKVLVTGPGAHSRSTLHGSWSYTWQGDNEYWFPKDTKTIYQAIQEKVGKKNVSSGYKGQFGKEEYYYFEPGAREEGHYHPEPNELDEEIARMKRKAREADYIVLCLGEEAYAESPGAIDSLYLPDYQYKLAKTAAATGKPVVLVLTEGRPRIIRDVEPLMHSIVLAYQPGSRGAEALADILFGDYNPEGKLPFSYPANPHDPVLYDHKYTDKIQESWPGFFTYGGYNPQYKFGHGLCYSTVEYKNMELNTGNLHANNNIEVRVDVSNTGKYPVRQVVELYTRDLYASVTPSQKRLRKFKKVSLAPGLTETVSFELNKGDLAFIGQDLKWVTEPGEFEVMIGSEKAMFSYSE